MSTSTTELSRTQVANALAERCADAYSADRYRSWKGVATALLAAGYNERQAEAVMRSKWARWAADGTSHSYGKVPAKVLVEYAEQQTDGELYDLCRETFGPASEGEEHGTYMDPKARRKANVAHPVNEPSRSIYTTTIKERLNKMGRSHGVDPRHVEAWMRIEHPTLDGLDPYQFTREVALAIACIEASTPAENEACARSFGL